MKGSDLTNKRVCSVCRTKETLFDYSRYTGKRHYYWYWHDGKLYCKNCHSRKIYDPAKYLKYHQRQLNFKGKHIFLDKPIRKGICKKCRKKIGDTYIAWRGKVKRIKETHTHHFAEYHKDEPLKDTIELCASCHGKETNKEKRLMRRR